MGIRKPSIHQHFQTKVELVVVLTQRYTHRINEQLLAIEAQHASAIERLRAYAEIFGQTFAQDRRLCMCGMLGAEADSLPDEIRAEVQRFFHLNRTWLGRVIADGQAAGQLRRGQTAANLAALWLSAMEGSLLMGRGAVDAPSPAMIAGALIDAWRP